jgi:hypothetical protein
VGQPQMIVRNSRSLRRYIRATQNSGGRVGYRLKTPSSRAPGPSTVPPGAFVSPPVNEPCHATISNNCWVSQAGHRCRSEKKNNQLG